MQKVWLEWNAGAGQYFTHSLALCERLVVLFVNCAQHTQFSGRLEAIFGTPPARDCLSSPRVKRASIETPPTGKALELVTRVHWSRLRTHNGPNSHVRKPTV